jgi:hypothetical protein
VEVASLTAIPHSQIVSQVMRRPALREELVARPRETLARRFDVKLAPGVEVVVVEDTASNVHVVVPSEPGLRGEEEGVIAEVLKRFREDAAFRKSVTTDPKAVIQSETGATLPAELDLDVVVETPKRRVIQLPPERVEDALTPAKVQALYGGGGDGDYYVIEESEPIGGCSNVDTRTWGCCESDVNVTTILHGTECCGETEGPLPDPGVGR